jgi:opacity protein-like surface antigen
MQKIFAAVVALALTSGAAAAADAYPKQGSTKDAPTAASVSAEDYRSWGGLYIGIGGGGSLGVIDALRNTTHSVDDVHYTVQEGTATEVDRQRFITDDHRQKLDLGLQGLFGEAELGYAFQSGRFVFGPRATIGISTAKGEASFNRDITLRVQTGEDTFTDYGLTNESGSLEVKRKWDWSAGGTAGVLVTPDTLVYGVLAYTQAKIDVKGNGKLTLLPGYDTEFPQFPGTSFNDSKTVDGVVLGAGMKTRLAKNSGWLLGVEYTYTKFDDISVGTGGTNSYSLNQQGTHGLDFHSNDKVDLDLDAHAIKATLTYQFGVDR